MLTSGTCVWHPPHESLLCMVPDSKNPHKKPWRRSQDNYISLHNIGARGKEKLLAKTKIDNLAGRCQNEKHASSIRMSLRPESSKVASASVTVAVELADTKVDKATSLDEVLKDVPD